MSLLGMGEVMFELNVLASTIGEKTAFGFSFPISGIYICLWPIPRFFMGDGLVL
jgi:hypothetical protein